MILQLFNPFAALNQDLVYQAKANSDPYSRDNVPLKFKHGFSLGLLLQNWMFNANSAKHSFMKYKTQLNAKLPSALTKVNQAGILPGL